MKFPDPNLPAIVIVDDSQDDAFVLRHRLRQGGVANPVITFDASAPARAYLRSASIVNTMPELLFIDITMSGAPGFIASVRNDHRFDEMKVIVATYSNKRADVERAIELRIDGYLMKFPDSDILAAYVRHGPWMVVPERQHPARHHALVA